MIICTCCPPQSDDKMFYLIIGAVITFIGSLSVSWLIFYLNKKKENENRNREIIEKLRNEIFAACDRIIRYSILTEHYALHFRLYEKLKELDKGTDKEKDSETMFLKYTDLSEEAGVKQNLAKTDLVKNVYDLFIYWKEKAEVLIPLINNAKNFQIRNFSGIYKDLIDPDVVIDKFLKEFELITDYNVKRGIGVYLIQIQREIAPEGMPID